MKKNETSNYTKKSVCFKKRVSLASVPVGGSSRETNILTDSNEKSLSKKLLIGCGDRHGLKY